MTPSQILAVKQSFAMVEPIADRAGAMFYARLFEIDPGLRPLFKGDIGEQSRKLMQVLATAVNALDRIETIVPTVQALGARHVAYGVGRRITTRWRRHCCGHWSAGSAIVSHRACAMPGSPPIRCSRRR